MYMNNNKLYQNGNFLLKVGFTVQSSIKRALNILFSTDMKKLKKLKYRLIKSIKIIEVNIKCRYQ